MKTSLSWIKRYVPDLNVTAQEYTDAMTLSGTKVEGYTRLEQNLDKIVVGQIQSIAAHPNADKLVICQVDIGSETIQIVTGAPNVFEGAKIPVVLVGGKVAGGHDGSPNPEHGIKIKAGKLRGVESFGMMCSIEELGSDRNFYPDAPENGIYILPDDTEVGVDAIELLGLREVVFEYEVTSNRVDCYSVMGIAREAAATFGKEFIPPTETITGNEEDVNDYLKVEVENSDLCPRYTARMVKNIKIGPSPKWLQDCLRSSGIRPINNLVDITNFVMEEYGQPMHAFDYKDIAGQKIIVRLAQDGEKFTTLDGQERTLDKDVLVIADGERSIAIGGIMGGENSMITDDVKTVVFESATFDGTNIRLSSKRIGLRTDSSGKFEKGLDPENALAAVNRACTLIEELGCGEVVGGVVDCYPVKKPVQYVKFEPEKINRLLGTDVSREDMLRYFQKLELMVVHGSDIDTGHAKWDTKDLELSSCYVKVPSFRQDIECMADLAEEVARFFGYDKIPTTLPKGEATMGGITLKMEVENMARNTAKRLGFSEAMSYSFESKKVFQKLMISDDSKLRNAIEIMNPLGEDFSIMRTVSLNGLLNSLSINFNRRNKNVKLFELANIYLPKALPVTELPDERMQFTLGFYGEGDFFTMKGVVEEFLEKVGIKKMQFTPKCDQEFLHPGRKASVLAGDEVLGYLGELHPQVAENYKIGEKTYVAVLDMPNVLKLVAFDTKYTGIAKYPAVNRDISMVVPKKVYVGQIEEMIEKHGGVNLQSYHLFDIYEGDQIQEGFKSIAYSISFRNKERTLEEKEVSAAMERILTGLAELGIHLRE